MTNPGSVVCSGNFKNLVLLGFTVLALAACGGGGSDSSAPPPTPTNQNPTANAGADFSVDEASNGALDGSGADNDGSISAFAWTQTSGPSVGLSSVTVAAPTFVAPAVDADTNVTFRLTVTDDGGATASDTVTVTIANVSSANISPTANAGSDLQGVIGQSVSLDASNSSDPDGTISSYLWTQIDNGSPILVLDSAQSMTASFEVPELSDIIEFQFELTVTDNDGAMATDTVVVQGRPAAAISVGRVTGNTANVNSLAEFTVSLLSRPLAQVSIAVASSDGQEGQPEQSTLVFSVDNWDTPQVVSVYGQNPNVVNGEQDYQIILSSATSADPLYNGIDPQDVTLRGIELNVSPPSQTLSALANVPFVLVVEPTYTGSNPLTFSISNAPAGMTIDFNTGVLRWLPPDGLSAGEQTADVTVNDGSRFSTATFSITVPQSDLLVTSYDAVNSQLTIVQADSSLNGVRLGQVAAGDALATLTLSKVDQSAIPDLPEGVMALTDGLIVNQPISTEVDIRYSLSSLPAGVAIDDVRFFTFGESSETTEAIWKISGYERQFSGTQEMPFVSFRFSTLPEFGFFGYREENLGKRAEPSLSKSLPVAGRLVEAARAEDITCVQQTFFLIPIDEYECTSSVDTEVTITVDNWGNSTLRWTSVSKEQLVSWIVDARAEFAVQSLGYDDEFRVLVETMDRPTVLGFVDSNEDFKVLHITDLNTLAASSIQGTSVHEYYHHAQGHPDTALTDYSLVTSGGTDLAWLYEGTARWVEDVIFDDINSYKNKEGAGSAILEVGLNAANGRSRNRPYQRFSFFKLLDEKCLTANDLMIDAFNYMPNLDPSGVKNLSSLLENMGCNFGDHFGANLSSSLASALGFYNVATQLNNQITSLDANETNVTFNFAKPNYRFRPTLSTSLADLVAQPDDTVYTLNNVSQVKSTGAVSFEVPAISGTMPDGKVAELLIQSTSQVYVSLASNDGGFPSTNTIDGVPHTWFNTSTQSTFIYGKDVTNLPKLFVTVVNANEDADATIGVTFRIRDELSVDTIITSHQSGQDVDDRVVTISGSIPDEGRASTNDVHITANGITTVVPMQVDGSFVGSVVMSLGANNVKAQGFSGNSPTTREEIITLNGVAAASTGTNALIASRVVFVLRWDTATDIDIYSKDPLDETIWFSDRTVTLGNLDRDDTSGFGPEVVSYRADGNNAYSNGQFDVDVHYYSGSPSTNYTIDVILNETEGANRRNYQFSSTTPLTVSDSSESGVDDTGPSRFNDILFINCNAARVCGLNGFDSSKLLLNTGLNNGNKPASQANKLGSRAKAVDVCSVHKQRVANKYGETIEHCDDERLK